MKEIVEDTISRNKKFKEEMQKRVKRLKELNAPQTIIDYEEMISQMTLVEYEIHLKEQQQEQKKIKSEYAKNNPIKQSIIEEIYNRESKLKYDSLRYSSDMHFTMAINPLSFMSEDDYENDLYIAFLEHAKTLYRERYKEDFLK